MKIYQIILVLGTKIARNELNQIGLLYFGITPLLLYVATMLAVVDYVL